MDVLPAQASSVSSERVFSSSKETCTLRRNRISRKLLEALQVLKFSYRSERLSFVDDLVAQECDYVISGPITEAAIDELMKAGNIVELSQLARNSLETI
jgi:hAT family C-terminal dimerisation region